MPILRGPLQKLEAATKEILSHSDRVIAHDDRRGMELTMLALIEKAAVSGQWQAAAWKLERIFPERYGRKFQPITMAQEQPPGDAPGKIYRVAIEGLPVAKGESVGIGGSFASDDNGPMGVTDGRDRQC